MQSAARFTIVKNANEKMTAESQNKRPIIIAFANCFALTRDVLTSK